MDFDLIKGNDDIIFFLHGWGGDKNSFSWIKNYIVTKSTLVFVSFSGFGNSPPPNKPYRVLDYTLELKDLIVEIAKGKKVKIVCHSFGARVAAKLCAVYPYLVEKLFIIDGAGIKPKRNIKYYIKIHKYKKLKQKVKKGMLDKSVLESYGSSDYKKLSNIMKKTFVMVVNEDLKDCFKSISQETFIFWGRKDKDTPLFMAKKMKKYIKNSSIFISNNSGHFSYLDDTQNFLACLTNFIL